MPIRQKKTNNLAVKRIYWESCFGGWIIHVWGISVAFGSLAPSSRTSPNSSSLLSAPIHYQRVAVVNSCCILWRWVVSHGRCLLIVIVLIDCWQWACGPVWRVRLFSGQALHCSVCLLHVQGLHFDVHQTRYSRCTRQTSPPVPPPAELETYASSLILPIRSVCMQTWRHPQNRKYITYLLPAEEDRATVTGNMYRKLVKFEHVAFEICERTDRQTDTLITVLRIPTGRRRSTVIQINSGGLA